jgi:hypothetical protein
MKKIKTLKDWFETTADVFLPNYGGSIRLNICEYKNKDNDNIENLSTVFNTCLRPDAAQKYFGDYILNSVQIEKVAAIATPSFNIIKPDDGAVEEQIQK